MSKMALLKNPDPRLLYLVFLGFGVSNEMDDDDDDEAWSAVLTLFELLDFTLTFLDLFVDVVVS